MSTRSAPPPLASLCGNTDAQTVLFGVLEPFWRVDLDEQQRAAAAPRGTASSAAAAATPAETNGRSANSPPPQFDDATAGAWISSWIERQYRVTPALLAALFAFVARHPTFSGAGRLLRILRQLAGSVHNIVAFATVAPPTPIPELPSSSSPSSSPTSEPAAASASSSATAASADPAVPECPWLSMLNALLDILPRHASLGDGGAGSSSGSGGSSNDGAAFVDTLHAAFDLCYHVVSSLGWFGYATAYTIQPADSVQRSSSLASASVASAAEETQYCATPRERRRDDGELDFAHLLDACGALVGRIAPALARVLVMGAAVDHQPASSAAASKSKSALNAGAAAAATFVGGAAKAAPARASVASVPQVTQVIVLRTQLQVLHIMREAARAAPLAIALRPRLMRHVERLIASIPRLPVLALSPAAAAADLAAGSNRKSPLSRAPHHGVDYVTQCDVLAPPAHANYASAESSVYGGKVKFLRHEQCARAVEICHALAHRCVEPAFAGVADIEWDAYAHVDDVDLLIVDELAWDRQAAVVCQEDRAAAMAAKGKKAASSPSPAASASAPADDSTRLLGDVIRLSHRLGGRRPDGYAWAASPLRASARQLSGDCRFAAPLVAAAAACDSILGDAAEALVAHQQRSGYQSSARSSGAGTSIGATRRRGSEQRPTVGLLTLLLRVCWHRSIGLPTALAALNALAPLQSVRDRLLTMRVGPGRARAYEAYFNVNDDEQVEDDRRDWADSAVSRAAASTGSAKGGPEDEDDVDDDDDDGGDDFVPFLAHRLLLECAQVSPLVAAYSLRLVRSLVRHDMRFLRYAANLLLHVPQAEGEHANAHAHAADAPMAAAHIYIEDVALNLIEAVLSAHALASESEPPEFAATVHVAAFADADAWKKVQGESRRRPSHRELDAALAAACALCAALRCMPDLVDETDRRSAAAAGFGSGGGVGVGHLMDAVPLGTLLIGCPEHCRLEEHESRPSAATRRAAVARRTLALATPLFRARTRSRAVAAQLTVIATEYTSPEQQTQQQEEDEEAAGHNREGGARSSKIAAGGAASASSTSAAPVSMPSADAMRHFARWREAREKQEDEADGK